MVQAADVFPVAASPSTTSLSSAQHGTQTSDSCGFTDIARYLYAVFAQIGHKFLKTSSNVFFDKKITIYIILTHVKLTAEVLFVGPSVFTDTVSTCNHLSSVRHTLKIST